MTTRRRPFLALSLFAAIVVLAGFVRWAQPGTAITRENSAKVRVGMTLVEVETILGGPPRNETTGPLELDAVEPADWEEGTLQRRWIDFMFVEPPAKRVMWHSDQVVIWVQWNAAGYVNACDYFPQRRAAESPLDMLRRWFGL